MLQICRMIESGFLTPTGSGDWRIRNATLAAFLRACIFGRVGIDRDAATTPRKEDPLTATRKHRPLGFHAQAIDLRPITGRPSLRLGLPSRPGRSNRLLA
jgi:hypothetical protein